MQLMTNKLPKILVKFSGLVTQEIKDSIFKVLELFIINITNAIFSQKFPMSSALTYPSCGKPDPLGWGWTAPKKG